MQNLPWMAKILPLNASCDSGASFMAPVYLEKFKVLLQPHCFEAAAWLMSPALVPFKHGVIDHSIPMPMQGKLIDKFGRVRLEIFCSLN